MDRVKDIIVTELGEEAPFSLLRLFAEVGDVDVTIQETYRLFTYNGEDQKGRELKVFNARSGGYQADIVTTKISASCEEFMRKVCGILEKNNFLSVKAPKNGTDICFEFNGWATDVIKALEREGALPSGSYMQTASGVVGRYEGGNGASDPEYRSLYWGKFDKELASLTADEVAQRRALE